MLLVTGATGFLGSNVMKAIGSQRKDVRILTHDYEKAKKMYPFHEVMLGDITQMPSLKGVGQGVDTIIHLAGIVSYTKPKEELFKANVEGTKNIIEACPDAKKIIFASSVSVYGEIKGIADEAYPTNPENFYGWSKLEAERLISGSGLAGVMLRIAPIYGIGSPQWLRNLRLLEKGFPIPKTNNLTHVAHISNVADAFALALKHKTGKSGGAYNIADGKPVMFTYLASELVRLLGRKPKAMPYWLVSLAAHAKGMKAYLDVLTMNRNYDISKAKRLGYDPKTDLSAELKKMVEWYVHSKTLSSGTEKLGNAQQRYAGYCQ